MEHPLNTQHSLIYAFIPRLKEGGGHSGDLSFKSMVIKVVEQKRLCGRRNIIPSKISL